MAVLLISGLGLTVSAASGLYLAAYASIACLVLSVALQTIPLWWLGAQINAGYAVRLTAIAIRIAVMPAAGLETVTAVLPRTQNFVVTPKTLCRGSDKAGLVVAGAVLTGVGVVAGLLWLLVGPGTAAAGACLAAVLWLATLTTTETMDDYAREIARASVPVMQPAGRLVLRHRHRYVARSEGHSAVRRPLARHTQPEGTA